MRKILNKSQRYYTKYDAKIALSFPTEQRFSTLTADFWQKNRQPVSHLSILLRFNS